MQMQHDNLFSVTQYKGKTYTTKILVQEMLFTNDSVLVTHSAEDMQKLVDNFARATSQFSLKINIRKTECVYQSMENLPVHVTEENITIRYEGLVQCKAFKYLSNTISDNAQCWTVYKTQVDNLHAYMMRQ